MEQDRLLPYFLLLPQSVSSAYSLLKLFIVTVPLQELDVPGAYASQGEGVIAPGEQCRAMQSMRDVSGNKWMMKHFLLDYVD